MRKMHQDYYTQCRCFKDKNKLYYARNRPNVREVRKTIAVIIKVKPVRSQEIIMYKLKKGLK